MADADYVVYRSLLLSRGSSGTRIDTEREILNRHFPSFTLNETNSAEQLGYATGALRVAFAGKRYRLKIVLPARYPYEMPYVMPLGWTPKSNPHIYTNGNICVMKSNQWHTYMSTALIVAKSAVWLHKYEIWLDKRVWPGPEQHDHGPLYRLRKFWHEL